MVTIDNDRCLQCGICIDDCYMGSLKMENEKVIYDPDACNHCGHCMAICPRECIVVDGDGYDCTDVEEISFTAKPSASLIRNMILVRRSVRRFSDDPVTAEEIEMILEAGKYAPTHMNVQGNAFLVVTDPEKRQELLEDTVNLIEDNYEALKAQNPAIADYGKGICERYRESGKDGIFHKAPVIIYVFSDDEDDGVIAATTMMFMAQAQQLGVCIARMPVRAFNNEAMREKWHAPKGKKCVMTLLVGNPEPEYFCSVPRKNPEVVRF